MRDSVSLRSQPWEPRDLGSVQDPGFRITMGDIDRYLRDREGQHLTSSSIDRYRKVLTLFYEGLPEDKRIRRGTLETWLKEQLTAGYSARTVNLFGSVCNGFLSYVGHREYQATKSPAAGQARSQQELNREEYLLLLQTAKQLRDERAYFVIKLIAATGVTAQSVGAVTVEALQAGTLEADGQRTHIPACLREELLTSAMANGIVSGPVLLTRSGAVIDRFAVNKAVQRVAQAAGLEAGKGTPRCLRRFFQRTKANIDAEVARLAQRAFDQQLELEQFAYGWNT